MKILVPIAGKSSFFPEKDYPFTKPLVEVGGVTMIERVVNNLRTVAADAEFVFVVSQEDVAQFSLDNTLNLLTYHKCEVVILKGETRGALCSCLMAIDHIHTDKELVIANGDQILELDLSLAVESFRRHSNVAGVITFESVHPRWSYVRLDDDQNVIQAEEKKVISRNAIAGFYYFSKGCEFVDAAMASIKADRAVSGSFFIAPALNELILQGKTVGSYVISNERYHSLYSPSKISEYEDFMIATSILRNDGKNGGSEQVNLLIPAAGAGSRFAKAGYQKPKPFISVLGKPMLERVIDNLSVPDNHIHLLLRKDHLQSELESCQQLEDLGCNIVEIADLTEGTACTALLARKSIDNDQPLLIANSDQLVDFDCAEFVEDCRRRNLDGSILVFRDSEKDPKWSFAKVDNNGYVVEVAEKNPISDLATVGIYLFMRGADFVAGAIDMIAANDRVNNEFYTCPVYNYLIQDGLRIGIFEVPRSAMHGLGTPGDLDSYLMKIASVSE
ncbi:MAG: glycosyltransferase family 2 protein [Kordiimonadaceae bacterium]|nr:glycosyltransferase family 2 protein [Kordiimonadaceae bacterium]MBO6569315.1 glycosyltransferase family 2 protein [Kordiimonadaceae bacterium]MBO6964791.1 glycosyltransferase family 2 protein [Kordiimonadaceae bacterium]